MGKGKESGEHGTCHCQNTSRHAGLCVSVSTEFVKVREVFGASRSLLVDKQVIIGDVVHGNIPILPGNTPAPDLIEREPGDGVDHLNTDRGNPHSYDVAGFAQIVEDCFVYRESKVLEDVKHLSGIVIGTAKKISMS